MNKFGIIFCGYNNENTVDEALSPFLDDERFVVAAVSVPFAEYIDQSAFEDSTTDKLRKYHKQGKIKHFIDSPRYIKDHEARNLAVDLLKREGVDFLFIWDADERGAKDQINEIIKFVESDEDSYWWSLSYKNYVFDDKTYLKEPFTPPRIFRMKKGGCSFPSFYWDNCVVYQHASGSINYLDVPHKVVPKEVAWIPHYTWPNNELGERKVNYQKDHHNGAACSFRWDEEKGLIFNEEYFKMRGEEIPETLMDNGGGEVAP